MTVLIEVRHEDGSVRRCDATCHNAKGTECHCVCGGKFHGKRKQVAGMSWEQFNEARESISLESGESIQLRIGV